MTKATKAKLDELNKTIAVLGQSQDAKKKTINYLVIAIVAVVAVIIFFVVLKKRRR